MGLFKPVETKENLLNVPDNQKVLVAFTRPEFEYLMDLIDDYRQSELQLTIDKERLKREKKQNISIIKHMQAHLRSVNIIKERMMCALSENPGSR